MSLQLILEQIETRSKYRVTGPTHIGRFPEIAWADETREIPEVFHNLDMMLQTPEEDKTVSRNHAAINRKEESYVIEDLESANGTYVNDKRIFQPAVLADQDIIRIGGNLRLKAHITEPGLNVDYAVLVGAGEDHPGCAKRDCDALAAILEQRGYAGNIYRQGLETTKASLKNMIRQVSTQSSVGSHTLFYFHGHGGTNGLMVDGQVVNPRELYKLFKDVRGKKAIIIEACNGGRFISAQYGRHVPENTTVIVASGLDRDAGETNAGGVYRGRLSLALCNYFSDHPEEFNLGEFKQVVDGFMPGATMMYQQQPRVFDGGRFTVMFKLD